MRRQSPPNVRRFGEQRAARALLALRRSRLLGRLLLEAPRLALAPLGQLSALRPLLLSGGRLPQVDVPGFCQRLVHPPHRLRCRRRDVGPVHSCWNRRRRNDDGRGACGTLRRPSGGDGSTLGRATGNHARGLLAGADQRFGQQHATCEPDCNRRNHSRYARKK
jgi:hypothetical protein